MKGVYTRYETKGEIYASYIIGETMEDICKKVKLRGINEQIVSQIQEIEIPYKPYNKIDLIHDVCFKCWMLLNANLITIEDALGDKGILHELIHYTGGDNDIDISSLLHDFKELEKIIGFA